MSCTPATVFAWIGTLLINAAFAALISWGAATNWPVGFVLSLVYTAVLFFLAGWLQRRYVLPSTKDGAEGDDDGARGEEVGGVGLLTSLLYLLAVVAIGVTGFFLPINLIRCEDGTSPPYTSSGGWTTDTSSFTQEVREWAEGPNHKATQANFAFLPTAGITLFGGNDGSATTGANDGPEMPRLWKVDGSSSSGPYVVSDVACPSDFVSVTDDTVCFVGSDQSSVSNSTSTGIYCDTSERGVVACTEGGDDDVRSAGAVNPSQLFVSEDATVWFKANPPRGEKGEYNWDTLIYSLDPSSMDLTLHSTNTGSQSFNSAGGQQQSSCDAAHVNRRRSILGLFVTALPVLVASVVLWVKRGVPSMPVATYAGLTVIVIFLFLIINPASDGGLNDLLMWWFPISAAVWLLALTFLHLTNRMREATLTWSLNVSSLVFFVGMIILYGVPGRYDDAWRWVLITLTSFLPLILLGTVTDRIFLLVLGAVGILMDVWRLTAYITELVDDSLRVPIQFVLLAVAGVGLGFLGLMLNRRQERIQKAVSRWADRFFGRWRREGYDGDVSGAVGSSEAETGVIVAIA